MFKVPGHFPRKAIRRLRGRGPRVSAFQSVQSEISLLGFTATELQTFLTGPPIEAFASIIFDDIDQILPFTTLEIRIGMTVAPGVDDAFTCNTFVTAGQTAAQAVAQVCTQINAYARVFGLQYPDMASLHAMRDPSSVQPAFLFQMPWGMLGATTFLWDGPNSGEGANGNPGVDNPLIFGLIAKRRHVFIVRNPYRDDYYGGDLPIG
jgi:hypothetical protein